MSTTPANASGIGTPVHVLIITTNSWSTTTDRWNEEVLDAFTSHNIKYSTLSYLHDAAALTPRHVADTYTHVCFLLLGEYTPHHTSFIKQARDVLPAAKRLNPRLRVLNGPGMAVWNSDKAYLGDLKNAGFSVPETAILSSRQPLEYVKLALNSQTHGHPIVVKPSISASGRNTHRVKDPANLTDDDDAFLAALLNAMTNGRRGDSRPSSAASPTRPDVDGEHDANEGSYGSILLQEFVPEVKNGEFSLCYFGHELLYTVLKSPQPGGWLTNRGHGGTSKRLADADVPLSARDVSERALRWIADKFEGEELGYARVDGLIKDDGSFVLMEVELLEPNLFFALKEVGSIWADPLCNLIKNPPGGLERRVTYN